MTIPRMMEREEAARLAQVRIDADRAFDAAYEAAITPELTAKLEAELDALTAKQEAEVDALFAKHYAEVGGGLIELKAKLDSAKEACDQYPVDVIVDYDDEDDEKRVLRCAKSGAPVLIDDIRTRDERGRVVIAATCDEEAA